MAKATKQEETATHVVVLPFRDQADFSKEWNKDDDVSHFDAERLQHLVSIGHVKETEKK